MPKPLASEVPAFYQPYVDLVENDDLIPALVMGGNHFIDLLKSIPEASGDYKYADDKWTIKQLVTHLIDAERVFAYRALTFARHDTSALPGFEQNEWVLESNADNRKLYQIISEYTNVRAATTDLFSSMTSEMLSRTGVASEHEISVNAIGFIIAGHEIHHSNILNERYFS